MTQPKRPGVIYARVTEEVMEKAKKVAGKKRCTLSWLTFLALEAYVKREANA